MNPCRSRFARVLMAVCLLFACERAALAQVATGEQVPVVPASLVVQLLGWIGEHSDYDVSAWLARPPEIRLCDCGEIVEYEGERFEVEAHIEGLYDSEARRILLVRPWRDDNPLDLSTLLHELVHLAQFEARHWECPGEAEWEAYQLQAAWLAEQGVTAPFNWVRIQMISRCDVRDLHPSVFWPD